MRNGSQGRGSARFLARTIAMHRSSAASMRDVADILELVPLRVLCFSFWLCPASRQQMSAGVTRCGCNHSVPREPESFVAGGKMPARTCAAQETRSGASSSPRTRSCSRP
jgi:hypothetical protein